MTLGDAVPAFDADRQAPPFASFWMGGFEGADHVNDRRIALDMAAAHGHVAQLEGDHARAAALGIRTVRESIGWRLAEPAPGRFDFRTVRRIAASARRHGLQVLWTLMHYGTPADVRLTEDAAIDRFAAFAAAVAREIAPLSDAAPVYNPVNEISFLAWAVSETDMVHPYRPDPAAGTHAGGSLASGYAVKRRLVRMALAGIDAMRAVDARSRFLHVEPLVHVVPPADRPELADLAERIADYQWQAWDLISGRREPALGGHPGALDLIGINHYHSSQWEAVTEERLWWHLRDPRRAPFGALVAACWARYRRPMLVAETSHFGEGRAQWLHEMASEVERVREGGIPLDGICLYPLVDRPDWSDVAQWHDSGLWDVDRRTPELRRVLCPDYAAALAAWQTRLPTAPAGPDARPVLLVLATERWDVVVGRTQQLVARLAGRWRLIVVEAPLPLAPDTGPARIDSVSHGPDTEVLLPRLPPDGGDGLPALVAAELRRRGIARDDVTAWVCRQRDLALASRLAPRHIVFDGSDASLGPAGHSGDGTPRRPDLVLTGSPARRAELRRGLDAPVHLVPNGVDVAAFAPDALDAGSAQAVQALLRQPLRAGAPRLGFCGAIDARIDFALVAVLADARPDWEIVMAGPVPSSNPAAVAVRSNLHWIGHQPQVRLPYLIASWDVCLLPFVHTGATVGANPVEALQYIAAEKPVVATPLPGLAELHPGTLDLADTAAGFVAACSRALAESPAARERRVAAMRAVTAHASWDARAAEVAELLAGLHAATPPPAAS